MPKKEEADGSANVTKEELQVAKTKTHDLDNPKLIKRFLSVLEKAEKKNWKKGEVKERINWTMFSPISDGWMIKYELEGFSGGRSLGVRTLKFYVSEEKKDIVEKAFDAFPKRSRQDPRTHSSISYPRKIVQVPRSERDMLDIDDIWKTVTVKKEDQKREDELADSDPFTL